MYIYIYSNKLCHYSDVSGGSPGRWSKLWFEAGPGTAVHQSLIPDLKHGGRRGRQRERERGRAHMYAEYGANATQNIQY